MSAKLCYRSLLPVLSLSLLGLVTIALATGATVSYSRHKQMQAQAIVDEQVATRIKLLEAVKLTAITNKTPDKTPQNQPDVVAFNTPAVLVTQKVARVVLIQNKNEAIDAKPEQKVASAKKINVTQASVKKEELLPQQKAISKTPSKGQSQVVTTEMIASAKKSNKIEGVDSAKLGVSKISTSGVFLRNGSTIKIGDRFPSGEQLLSLDPDNGQIVTDKRTLLIF